MQRAGTVAVVVGAILAIVLGSAGTAGAAPTAGKSVIGGRLATVAEFPFSAMILRDGKFHCSGAVISPTRVLTAGHCAKPGVPSLSVVTGRSSLGEEGGQVLGVTAAALHPGYAETKETIFNDIAVFVLGGATTAPPIALPGDDTGFTRPGFPLTIAAYGERQPNILKKARVARLATAQLLVRGICTRRIGGFSPETMICALGNRFATAVSGRRTRGVFASGCFGDSGGPLISFTSAGPTVFGVTSFGRRSPAKFGFVLCGLRRGPGVYTRVSAYLPFIQANL